MALSEDYKLHVELDDTGVVEKLQDLDNYAKKLDGRKINMTVSIKGNTKALSELAEVNRLADQLDGDTISSRLSIKGTSEAVAETTAVSSALEKVDKAKTTATINVKGTAEALAETEALQKQLQAMDVDKINIKYSSNAESEIAKAELLRQKAAAVQNESNARISRLDSRANVQNTNGNLLAQQRELTLAQRQYNALAKQVPNYWTNAASSLSKMSTGLGRASNLMGTLSRLTGSIARVSLTGGGIAAAGIAGGATALVGGAIQYTAELEKAEYQLRAQGIAEEKVQSIMKENIAFANKSPFGITNLTQSQSQMNAYIGDIDKAITATEQFGTSIFASGGNIENLDKVAVNLGQLSSGGFIKTDWKELVKQVPAISQAFKDMTGADFTWDNFNKALGDNPDTKEIERTGNALDLVTAAITRWNTKTDALEMANKSLPAKWDNMTESFKTQEAQLVKSSGLYDAIGRAVDTLRDKLTDPATTKALEGIFKDLIPVIDNISKEIKNFNIQDFINGIKRGFNDVKSTIQDIMNNPLFKFGKGAISKLLGLDGTEKTIGDAIGNLISGGLKLGISSIGFKGLSLVLSGAGSIASIGGLIARSMGKGMSGGALQQAFAKTLQPILEKQLRGGLETAAAGATSNIASSGSGLFSSFSKAGMNLGKGLLGISAGIAGLAGSVWLGAEAGSNIASMIGDFSDNIKKIDDNLPDNLANLDMLDKKIQALRKWATQLSGMDLSGGFNTAYNALATVGAGLLGVGGFTGGLASPATWAGAAIDIGVLIGQGVEALGNFNDGLKLDNIGKLVDLPSKLNKIPELDASQVSGKIKNLTKFLNQMLNAINPRDVDNSMFGLGASGFLAMGDSTTSKIEEAVNAISEALPNKATTDKLSSVLKNLNSIASSFGDIGTVSLDFNKIEAGFESIDNIVSQLNDLSMFKQRTKTTKVNNSYGRNPNAGGAYSDAQNTITTQFSYFEQQVNELGQTLDFIEGSKLADKLTKLKSLAGSLTNLTSVAIDPATVTVGIQNVFAGLRAIADSLNGQQISAGGSSNGKTVLDGLRELSSGLTGLNTESITAFIGTLQPMMTALNQLNALQVDGSKIALSLSNIKTLFNTLTSMFTGDNGTAISNMGAKGIGSISAMIGQIQPMITAVQSIQNMGDLSSVTENVHQIKTAINELMSIGVSESGKSTGALSSDGLTSLASGVRNLGAQASTTSGQVTKLTIDVNDLTNAINNIPKDTTVNITMNGASEAINAANSLTWAINAIPTSKTVYINTVNSDNSAAIGGVVRGGRVQTFANGGMASKLFAGAKQTLSHGQDTIRALLAEGEGVLRRTAVAKLTPRFVNQVNSGKLGEAYQTMTERMIANYSRTISNNNVYNRTATVNNYFTGQSQPEMFVRNVTRGLRG